MARGGTGSGAFRAEGIRHGGYRWAWAAVGILAAAGCARQSAPPGGPPDARPPVVVRTQPESLARVDDFRGPVRFEFDERISEQAGGGTLNEAVTVSPKTGAVRVSHGRRSLEVEIDGGFRPGVVYRVTLQPVVRDMFGNALRDPFELVFSTGAELDETAVAGEVWDRVTGRGVADVQVQAVGADSLVHLATSGEGGIYALRYVPSGDYALTAFQDQDLDGTPDSTETQGRANFQLAARDTVFVDVSILAPDTTGAVLLGAEILDSVTVALRFDDYLDPAVDLTTVDLTVSESEGGAVPVAARYHAADWMLHVGEVRDSLARADSIARANAAPPTEQQQAVGVPAPDSALMGAPADSLVATDSLSLPTRQLASRAQRGPPDLPGGAIQGLQQSLARGRKLPGRRIVLVLEEPLASGRPHVARATGVVNLNGLASAEAEVSVEPLVDAGPGGTR